MVSCTHACVFSARVTAELAVAAAFCGDAGALGGEAGAAAGRDCAGAGEGAFKGSPIGLRPAAASAFAAAAFAVAGGN